VLVRQINEAPRPPSEAVRGLDPALEATILEALAKRPEDARPSGTPALPVPTPPLRGVGDALK
jgi:hypothetical protein